MEKIVSEKAHPNNSEHSDLIRSIRIIFMKKTVLLQFKKKLEKEKETLEKELSSFAKKDIKPEGDWDTRYPKFNGGKLDEESQEVEKYISLLPVEHALELRLRDVNLALEKIKHPLRRYPKYGICEKCGKKISVERLKICPEARFCKKCRK